MLLAGARGEDEEEGKGAEEVKERRGLPGILALCSSSLG